MRIFIFTLLLTCLGAFAQDQLLSISDAITGTHLYPSGPKQLTWLPNSNRIAYRDELDGKACYVIREVLSNGLGKNFTVYLPDINKALFQSGRDSIDVLPYAQWTGPSSLGFISGEEFLAYDFETLKISRKFKLDTKSTSRIYSEDFSGYVGLIKGGFTYRMGNVYGSRTSNDDGRIIGDAVHRYEFGITNGLFLSDDHTQMAYYDMNESMVTQYPIYELAQVPAGTNMIRYPTAGSRSHEVSVYVRKFTSNEGDIRINTGKPDDHYLTNIAWLPDGSALLIAELNRDQNHMQLNMYSTETGEKIRTLFEEHNDKYVEPEHPAVFVPGKDQFLWWSERDGYNHLYLYDLEGKLIKQLSKGDWVVTDFHGFDSKSEKIYITATKESPLERHLYCVDIRSGKMKKLTDGEGVHRINLSADGSMFIDQYSSPTVPLKTIIMDEDGKMVELLNEADDPLSDYKLGDMEIGSLKSKGGQDLFYRVFKPVDFDKKKKYPVVVYLYNGPHLQLVTRSWLGGANLWYQYMAQKGFVVFTIDGRGSANRGFDFESSIFRNMADLEMEDQLRGVEWLKSQSWVDSERIGLHGWSYGGYMTINLMTRNPGIYKVAVAGGPVIDWSLYEVMYTERYMDRPEENPEGYQKTDLKNYVSHLEGKMLIIHGALDDVVLWQHSLQYIQHAIREGVQLDYFVYPHHPHNVRGQDRVHLYEMISNYFIEHL